jgi:hypothetical protein
MLPILYAVYVTSVALGLFRDTSSILRSIDNNMEYLVAVIATYSPKDMQSSTYAYIVTIYSLLISALLSLVRGQLTQNDATFVLVAVVSPISTYLWFCAGIPRFWQQAHGLTNGMSQHQKRYMQLLILGSLALWITLLVLILTPSSHIDFSQPACKTEYGKQAMVALLWLPLLALRIFLISGVLHIIVALKQRRKLQTGYSMFVMNLLVRHCDLPSFVIPYRGSDIVQWTHDTLTNCWPTMTCHGTASFLIMITFSTIPALAIIPYLPSAQLSLFVLASMLLWFVNTTKLYHNSWHLWSSRIMYVGFLFHNSNNILTLKSDSLHLLLVFGSLLQIQLCLEALLLLT